MSLCLWCFPWLVFLIPKDFVTGSCLKNTFTFLLNAAFISYIADFAIHPSAASFLTFGCDGVGSLRLLYLNVLSVPLNSCTCRK